MGTVKGTVHAGAKGNREAIVAALNLSPTQLRIADVITRSPDEDDTLHGEAPEIAYIKDNRIFIEEILQKRK
jgi:septum site-determining protein MinC